MWRNWPRAWRGLAAKSAAGVAALAVIAGCGTPSASSFEPVRTDVVTVNPLGADGGLAEGWSLGRTREVNDLWNPGELADCSQMEPSAFAVGPNTYGSYGCGDMASNLIACWTATAYPQHLLCLSTPDQIRERRLDYIEVAQAPRNKTAGDPNASPLLVELDDGSQWMVPSHFQFAPRSDGLQVRYTCVNEVGICGKDLPEGNQRGLVGNPDDNGNVVVFDREQPAWTVRVGETNVSNAIAPPTSTMTVIRAWFVSGAVPAS